MKRIDFQLYKNTKELVEYQEPDQSDIFEFKTLDNNVFLKHYMTASHKGFLEGVKTFRNILAAHPKADWEMRSLANRICLDLSRECDKSFKNMEC